MLTPVPPHCHSSALASRRLDWGCPVCIRTRHPPTPLDTRRRGGHARGRGGVHNNNVVVAIRGCVAKISGRSILQGRRRLVERRRRRRGRRWRRWWRGRRTGQRGRDCTTTGTGTPRLGGRRRLCRRPAPHHLKRRRGTRRPRRASAR